MMYYIVSYCIIQLYQILLCGGGTFSKYILRINFLLLGSCVIFHHPRPFRLYCLLKKEFVRKTKPRNA